MQMKYVLVFLSFLPFLGSGQYQFAHEKEIACTTVKNQEHTGTCWSFSTLSFLESELLRQGKEAVDLSEMYIVRHVYFDKARNYLFRQGKASFGQGSLAHDVVWAAKKYGMMPESVFSGKADNAQHNHTALAKELKSYLDRAIKDEAVRRNWREKVEAILDDHLGAIPAQFAFEEGTYTAQDFAKKLKLDLEQYITLTSYTHQPFYETFVLEIPDNYANGQYYNLPIDELQKSVDAALAAGYTVAWNGDVSEKGFDARRGIAVLPDNEMAKDIFTSAQKEQEVDQALRQSTFESYATKDDHLMHIVGIAKDQNGTKYYITKNSWGKISPYKGFLYMSAAYFRLKTVGVMLHKAAIPVEISDKLGW
ncbi:MAG: C1 family peptidase [Bacteroidota bacterium]